MAEGGEGPPRQGQEVVEVIEPGRETALTMTDREVDEFEEQRVRTREQEAIGEEAEEILDERIPKEDVEEEFSERENKLIEHLRKFYSKYGLSKEQMEGLVEKVLEAGVPSLEKQNIKLLAKELNLNPDAEWWQFKDLALMSILEGHLRDEDGDLNLNRLEQMEGLAEVLETADAAYGKFQNAKGWFTFILSQVLEQTIDQPRR